MIRPILLLAVVAPLMLARPALAEDLAKPSGRVILTVSGNIDQTNTPDNAAEFDLAMLDALPQTSFETSTILDRRHGRVFRG